MNDIDENKKLTKITEEDTIINSEKPSHLKITDFIDFDSKN